MSDNTIRDQLANTIIRALLGNIEPACCGECDHQPILGGYLDAEMVAKVIDDQFLVVPRSDVIGTEYAIECRNDSRGLWRYRADNEADARTQSAARQVAYAKTYPVSRPILPWSPITPGEVPDAQ